MPPPVQGRLGEDAAGAVPAESGNPLFCHEDFLTELEANRANPVGKRASLLLQRLLQDERREFFKSTQGVNKGWRRSRLGGNNGSHFYAWWAPRGAPPVGNPDAGFEGAPEGSIFLRAIRHHDNHAPLDAQRFHQYYVPLTATDVRDDSLVPSPWTPQQTKFAHARQNVRTLRGYPGSGKTTALWHAAEAAGHESVLYVTYSRDLALLAHDYFTKLVPAYKRFRVVTFPELLRLCGSAKETPETARSARARFLKEAAAVSPRILGPWVDARAGLYDEMHAHLIGSALPEALGRWQASRGRRMPPKDYRSLREKSIGRTAADAVIETAEAIEKRIGQPVEDAFFPELALAYKGLERLRGPHSGWLANAGLLGYDCIALDEAQDLTPLEALLLIELAERNKPKPGTRVTFLAAGDEAQTVRPSDFEWGWLHDLLYAKLGAPTDYELRSNLRSPQRIAEIINRVWVLYGHLAKQERPSGNSRADLDDEAGDQIVYCTAAPGEELSQLLRGLAEREGLAIINLTEEIPVWVPEEVRAHVVTVADVKGLDFHSVCVLNGGEFLMKIRGGDARGGSIGDLSRRLAIDQLRVAVSRPAERLYWLDVNPSGSALAASRQLLSDSGMELPQPVVPAVVLKSLEEEALSAEERVQLCMADARQFLSVKPDIAWSRANQAVTLLGPPSGPGAVRDVQLRRAAHLALTEISFCLAFRNVSLSHQLGAPDLWRAAVHNADLVGRRDLGELIAAIELALRKGGSGRMDPYTVVFTLSQRPSLDPWMRMELQPFAEELASGVEAAYLKRPDAAFAASERLAPFFELFEFPNAEARTKDVRLRAIKTTLEGPEAARALALAEKIPDCDPAIKARCVEAAGRLDEAASMYLAIGALKEALHCYRSMPDFEKALGVAAKMGNVPAAESLLWLDQMRKLAAKRPADFNKVMLPSEKQLLEDILESGLGVARKRPAAKKAAKKAAAAKPAVKKVAAKPASRAVPKAAPPKKRISPWHRPGEVF